MNSKIISKIVVSALPAVCLSAHNVSDSNAGELLREIQSEQCKLPYTTQNQIMQNVFKNYDNLNIEVKNTLDILWRNDAGNLLLRRLYNVIKNDTQQITILWDTCDEEGDSNLFNPNNLSIYLNKNKFGKCIGYRNGELCALSETLDDVLFHEMTHGLHTITGMVKANKRDTIQHLHKFPNNRTIYDNCCESWSNDEEVRTITGWHLGKDRKLHFDCLNANSYMVLKSLKNGTPINRITQRIFHYSYENLQDISKPCRSTVKNIIIQKEKYLDKKI